MRIFQGLCNGREAYLAGCVMLITGSFISCTKANVQYGSQFAGDQNTQIIMVDTFSIQTGTVELDSFVTAASGTALVGSYKDDIFGQINAESYFQFQPPSFSDKSIAYDSLELVMIPKKKNFYGDSIQPLQINVYRLTSAISKSDNGTFYNTDQIAHESSPLGSKFCNVYPGTTDSISIRLNDDLGKTLLNLLQSGSSQTASSDNFTDYFKGLCVSASQGNAFVADFKDSIELRIHYRDITTSVPVSKTAVFSVYDNAKLFNHISVDRTGTPLSALPAYKKSYITSTATSNESFMQAATGAVVKIQVPYIGNLLQIPGFVKIYRAVLTVKPINGTYAGYYTLPDSLRISATDKNNALGTDLAYSDGSVQYGSFTRDYLYEQNTGYSYDLTSYLTQQLTVPIENGDGVILSPQAGTSNIDFRRVVIGDQQNKISRISLQLYYLTVQ